MADVGGLPEIPLARPAAKTARIEELIRSGAWTDAALALIDLGLPLWQVSRLAYDAGRMAFARCRANGAAGLAR